MKIVKNHFCSNCGNQSDSLISFETKLFNLCSNCIELAYGSIFPHEDTKRCPDCGDYGIIQDEHGRNSTCPCHLPKITYEEIPIIGPDGVSSEKWNKFLEARKVFTNLTWETFNMGDKLHEHRLRNDWNSQTDL